MNVEASSSEMKQDKQKIRRLNLLQKGGLFSTVPPPLSCKQATTVDEYRHAYNIVYESFVEQKYILPNSSHMRVRPWETMPENGVFICKSDDTVVGVTGTVMDSESLKLPSDHSFHEELDKMREEGAVICEISNQAILPEYRNTPVVTELMQAAFGHAWFKDVTDLVCAISPKQRKFFELIGFEQVGEIKSYSDVVFDPVALLRLKNIQTRYSSSSPGNKTLNTFWDKFFITQNPFIPIFPLWQRMVNVLFANRTQTTAMFEGCWELFEDADIAALGAIEKNLGISLRELTSRIGTDHLPAQETDNYTN